MKRVIITGASGMIGSHLTDICLKNGVEVAAVARVNSKKIKNIAVNPAVRLIECDLQNIEEISEKLSGEYDVFFHFAWDGVFGDDRNDELKQASNIIHTLKAIEVASRVGCKKFVFSGSQAEYGLKNCVLRTDTVAEPITAYGAAKFAASNLGVIAAAKRDMQFCSGRIVSAYGARDNGYTMIMTLIDKLTKGEKVDLTEGNQIWDYVYGKDVADAFYKIGERGVHGKFYPIASGESRPLREFIKEVCDIVGGNAAQLNFGAVKLGQNAVTHLEADISDLKNDTGFAPKYSFKDGIKETFEWIKNNANR